MAITAGYNGASHLPYFHPDQKIEVKTILVRFLDLPSADNGVAAWAGSVLYYDAQTLYDDLPGSAGCDEDEDCSDYLLHHLLPAVSWTGCMMAFCPNAFTDDLDLDVVSGVSLDTTKSYAMDTLAAIVLHEFLLQDRLMTGRIVNTRGPVWIQDWNDPPVDGADPVDGYGPCNGMRINQLYAQPGQGANSRDRPNPYHNVEIYVWFALEDSLRRKCP